MKYILVEEFGKAFIPKKARPYIRSYIMKAGLTDVPYKLFGLLFWATVLITGAIFAFLIWPHVEEITNPLIQFLSILIIWVIIHLGLTLVFISILYYYYDYKIFARTKEMEMILPDFLRNVVENLKGGLSFDKSLWDSIKPQYGILASEISLVAKKVMTGEDIDEALYDFTMKYDSPMLRRSFHIIIEGLKGGGEIAGIIDKVEDNLRETQEMKKEISATNSSYTMFITFIVCIISPFLFGLSYTLLHVIKNVGAKLTHVSTTGISGASMIGNLSVNPDLFVKFSVGGLFVISLFAASIVAIIKNGNVRQGLKYIPFFSACSVIMYYIFKAGIFSVLGGIIPQ